MKNIFRKMCIVISMILIINVVLPTSVFAVPEDEKIELNSPETMIAGLVNGLATAINWLISLPIGYQVTIDDIVFNQYKETKVDFFADLKGAECSSIIWGTGGDGNGGLVTTVNQCYSFFNKIAVLVYMVMLVYMGLRIILSSTGQSLSHYKTLFMHWVVGVAILFLYPFAMKYIIQINDTFVNMVSANKGDSYVAPQKNQITAATTDSVWKIDFEKNPFNGAGTDYMSMIANDAIKTKRLALSFAYLILTWQLITLVLHYYKRLFMVGFLIAIFPLVAMFYALDKIGDGKSQAFDHWNKEFMLNVLIQSFHAIVYVFVCSCVGVANTGTQGHDYILIITGTTFLFTGEQIVKGIFSQNSGVKAGAAKGLADTAAWSMLKVKVATDYAAKATKTLVGSDSAAARLRNAHYTRKATSAKLDLFDRMATTTPEAPNAGLRFESTRQTMSSIDHDSTLTDEQKQASKAEALKLANAVADINNPNSRSVEELQKAFDVVKQTMQTDPNNVALGNLKLTPEQMGAVDAMGREIAHLLANHVTDPVQIRSKVTATLDYTLGDLSDEEKNKYINMALYQVAQHGAIRYADPLASAEDEIESGTRALSRAFSTFNYRSGNAELTENQEIKRAQVQQAAEDWAKSFHEDGSEATDEEKELAEGLMIIANRKSGLYTAEEYLSATEKIKKNLGYNSDAAQEMSKSLDLDIDLMRHGIARTAKAEGSTSAEIEEVIQEYEADVREGVYDDEVSGHELITIVAEKDATAREKKKQKMINDVSTARVKANDYEREETRAIAVEILSSKHVDVTEGGIDTTTRFLNGQTREDILKERRAASFGVVLDLAGIGKDPGKGKYSEKYEKNMKNYHKHFMGDQEGDYYAPPPEE